MDKKKKKDDPIMLGLRSIAEKLDVSTKTVKRMAEDGQIRLYKMRGKLFAKYDELEEDLEKILDPLI